MNHLAYSHSHYVKLNGFQGDAEQLELAAAEMAQSAATLVQLERELVSLPSDTATEVRQERVQARMEAAALLERKMAAMEAVLAARRSPGDIVSPQPKEEVREVEETPTVVMPDKPPTYISTGPAAGDGHELILQVCHDCCVDLVLAKQNLL